MTTLITTIVKRMSLMEETNMFHIFLTRLKSLIDTMSKFAKRSQRQILLKIVHQFSYLQVTSMVNVKKQLII